MSTVKKLPKWYACCEITIRGTDRVCGNAAAYEWEGQKICGMHAPRKHCRACNRPIPVWEVIEVPSGIIGGTVPMCVGCAEQNARKPFGIEVFEDPKPRRKPRHGKLCPVCCGLPHRRAPPKCRGCGNLPGPAP